MNYADVIVARLEVDGTPVPSIHCTVDGSGKVYLHGGRNRPEQGRVMCFSADLDPEWSIETHRGGFSEVALGDDYLIAVAHGSWFPMQWVPWLSGPEGVVFTFRNIPVELIDSAQAVLDSHPDDAFHPTVYKLGVP